MRRTISLVIVLLTCTITAFAAEQVQREFQRTVAIPAGRSFQIDHSFGRVAVRAGQGREASIHASIECSADTRAEAESLCNQIQISVNEGSSAVRVQSSYPQQAGRRNVGFRANFDIVVPENTPVEATNRFGDVTIADLQAAITINNSNGGVRLTGGRGRRDVDNSFGNVEVRSTAGDVRIKNTNGTVTVSDAGAAVEVSNRFGGVSVTGIGSRLIINGANGNIDVKDAAGDVSISNSFGSVTLAGAKGDVSIKNQNGAIKGTNVGGDVTATTSFASIALDNVEGDATATANNSSIRLTAVQGGISAKTSFSGISVLDASGPVSLANQNGSVTVESSSARCEPISVNTSFSPIRVTLRDGAGYNLDARTSFARVNTAIPIQDSSQNNNTRNGQALESSIRGRIEGAGNCELRLINQNGNIDILKSAK
jgi:hypothetical protein